MEIVFILFRNGVAQKPELVENYAILGGLRKDEMVVFDVFATISGQSGEFNVNHITVLDHVKVQWNSSADADVESYKVKIDDVLAAQIDADTGEIISI